MLNIVLNYASCAILYPVLACIIRGYTLVRLKDALMQIASVIYLPMNVGISRGAASYLKIAIKKEGNPNEWIPF
jgi:hypothetical protein